MALIVEDGTGMADAEAYVSVADATTYCTHHGLTAWTGADAVKEVALRNATQYLDTQYIYKSEKVLSSQALEFPRAYWDWTDPEIVRLKAACCELAVKALSGALYSEVSAQETIKVKVGPIEKTTRPSSSDGQKKYPNVEALIRPLVAGMGQIPVARA